MSSVKNCGDDLNDNSDEEDPNEEKVLNADIKKLEAATTTKLLNEYIASEYKTTASCIKLQNNMSIMI